MVFNVLAQGSTSLNQQFDTTYHGDASDLQIDPSSVVIAAGWQPQGSNAPSDAPELVIVITPVAPATAGNTNPYNRASFIGLLSGVKMRVAPAFRAAAAPREERVQRQRRCVLC